MIDVLEHAMVCTLPLPKPKPPSPPPPPPPPSPPSSTIERVWFARDTHTQQAGGGGGVRAHEQVKREVYAKVVDPGRWLFVNKEGEWVVGSTANKDTRKTRSTGAAYSMASAGGMPPPAGAGRWLMFIDGEWVEQTVEVRHG